jgi:ferredoxin--NADP+ reductase
MIQFDNVVANLFKATQPLIGTVVENRRLSHQRHGENHDVRHVVISYKEPYPYIPGQSVGIIPAGIDPKTNKPYQLRLYSIASDRHGDLGDNQSVSVCVVRHFWNDPKTGLQHIPGVGSQYICNLKPGDQVQMTGPVGKHFIIPGNSQNRDLILTATGTGIAPYRGMIRELFKNGYQGRLFLYFGVPYRDCVLYDDEFSAFQKKHKNFFYRLAISREETNPFQDEIPTRENRMYVQVRMHEDRAALKEVLSKPDSVVYLCGLKGMEAGIFPVLEHIGKSLGSSTSFTDQLKKDHRLLVEVY